MSPIFLKDYTCSQTDLMINITVRVPGISVRNSDLSITDKYIKINFRNYIWELFLANAIDSDKSKLKIGNGLAVLHLTKKKLGRWNSIEQHVSPSLLAERRANEISKVGEMSRKRHDDDAIRRQRLQTEAREHYQKLMTEEKERTSRQLEKEKQEILSGCCPTYPEIMRAEISSQSHVAAPIRPTSSIQVEFAQLTKTNAL